MENITRYAAGFAFADFGKQVVLIEKNKPRWQNGKLNGVGGHIEQGETPLDAMRREFEEETGLRFENWTEFCKLHGDGFAVHFFRIHLETRDLEKLRSVTDEKVGLVSVDGVWAVDHIPNLAWLIPMALSVWNSAEKIQCFDVQEIGEKKR